MDVKTPRSFFILFLSACAFGWVQPIVTLAQTSWPRLHKEGQVTRTPFLAQGCHALGCKHHAAPTKSLLVEDNFDMGPSIARSDSFDVVHYDLMLDMTDYWDQTMQGLATIDFTVLQGGTTMWWDLESLVVDSVHWNDESVTFSQLESQLQVDAPAPMQAGEQVVLDIWYGGEPGSDPYWGGMYFASDLIYNLGIGLTTIPPNFGRVWYPCFDNFVERATYTYRIRTADGRRAHNQGHLVEEDSLWGRHLAQHLGTGPPHPDALERHCHRALCRPRLRARRRVWGHSRAFDEQGERLGVDANQICRPRLRHRRARTLVGSLRLGARWLRPHHRRRPSKSPPTSPIRGP